jgi:hypothetical protein
MKTLVPILVLGIIITLLVLRGYRKRPKHEVGWPPQLIAQVKANKEAREQVKAGNPELFTAVSQALFKADPIGITAGIKTTDEYDPEAGTIIPRLRSCTSEEETLQVVYEEFCKWFGADIAGAKDNYRAVSKEIWEIWNRHVGHE